MVLLTQNSIHTVFYVYVVYICDTLQNGAIGYAVYRRVRDLSEFITNILICAPKMYEGLTDLKRHEGE